MSISDWVRPEVRKMNGYQPGEQPALGEEVIKLNTNENPYPPPPVVMEALRQACDPQILRRYPRPDAAPVRKAAAQVFALGPDQVVVGNGSDELLTMLMRAFASPGAVVAAPGPTYSLFETLVTIQGAEYQEIPWTDTGEIPVDHLLATEPDLVFVVRPNAPTGHACSQESIAALCRRLDAPVVLDEAYAHFADDDGLSLLAEHPNLIILRSFSKGLSLAGLRLGLGFARAEVAAELHKVRDSYNVDALAQAAATAALNNREDFRPTWELVKAERRRLTEALRQRGFVVADSQANFVFARIPGKDGGAWYQSLKERGVLVRHFPDRPELADGFRITVGKPEENEALLEALDAIAQRMARDRL